MQSIKLFLATFIVCICLDAVWLTLIAKNAYLSSLADVMRKSGNAFAPNWVAIFIVYLLMVIGILLFVLPKAETSTAAIFWGALFGLILYGVFDFTNYAILERWPLKISLIDIGWGVALCALTTLCAFYFDSQLN